MNAEFNWWLLILGVVGGAGLVWLVLGTWGRRDDASTNEVESEAAWISMAMAEQGEELDPATAAAVLRLHRAYLATDGGAADEWQAAIGELVVVANGLARPPVGQEYRCWVTIDGRRIKLGEMYFTGTVAYWIGQVDLLGRVQPGALFGISLVDASGAPLDTDPVISGTL